MPGILPLLNNLASEFKATLPGIVCIAPNGVEKTSAYLQLCRFKTWGNFLASISSDHDHQHQGMNDAIIYPLLQSNLVRHDDLDTVEMVRNKHKKIKFSHLDCQDRIKAELQKGTLAWTDFWVQEIFNAVRFNKPKPWVNHLQVANEFLKNKEQKVVFLFDGIEDIFSEFDTNIAHEMAIDKLLSLPRHLVEINDSHIGIIIFIRRNSLPHIITQNLGQFRALYRKFDI